MSSISCLCADPLASVVNDACSAVKYGNQIVKLFIQKMDGTAFDSTVGNDVAVEADWDTKIAAVDDSKIISIGSINYCSRSNSCYSIYYLSINFPAIIIFI